jgi:hypothetical protein
VGFAVWLQLRLRRHRQTGRVDINPESLFKGVLPWGFIVFVVSIKVSLSPLPCFSGSEQESEQVMDWRALLKAKIFVRSVDERERMDEDFRVAGVSGVSERGQ